MVLSVDRRYLSEGPTRRTHCLCRGDHTAVGVNTDGRHEALGMEIGTSEAEPIWTEFLLKPTRKGRCGVKLVFSYTHEGIKAAVSKVLSATWQHCRVHFMRNALARAGKSGRRVVSAFIATAFAQDTTGAASQQSRNVSEQDVLAYMTFPRAHLTKLHSTNPIERLNGEINGRTEVVDILPNVDAIVRLFGAFLLEQNEEWALQRSRYTMLELIGQLGDDPLIRMPAAS